MRGTAVVIAAAFSTVLGCGTITPVADPSDGGTAIVSVPGDAGMSKKNGENGQGGQTDNGGHPSSPQAVAKPKAP
jgi:hypothetical protein